jgi:ligand-binding SRPBCC domain-containing protein
VLSVDGTFPLELGSEVRVRTRQWPLPWAQSWHVRIAQLEPPTLMVDEMLRGPFAAWRHEHRLTELPDGRTRLTDHVTYRLPGGPLGRLADTPVVRRLLRSTFRSRHERTRALLEAP